MEAINGDLFNIMTLPIKSLRAFSPHIKPYHNNSYKIQIIRLRSLKISLTALS